MPQWLRKLFFLRTLVPFSATHTVPYFHIWFWSPDTWDPLPPPLGTRLHVMHRHACRENTHRHKVIKTSKGICTLIYIYMKLLWINEKIHCDSINSNLYLKLDFMFFAVNFSFFLKSIIKFHFHALRNMNSNFPC